MMRTYFKRLEKCPQGEEVSIIFYEQELQFLCDVFHKSRVRALVIPKEEIFDYMGESPAEDMLDPRFVCGGSVYRTLCHMKHQTVYKLTDLFYRHFLCLLLPSTESPTVLLIGPYLPAPVSPQERLMLGEEIHIPPQEQRYLEEYYNSLPILPSDSHLIIMFTTFCERLWDSPSFAITVIRREADLSLHPQNAPAIHHDQSDALINMKVLEQRYAFENQLLRSVSLGQIHMEDQVTLAFSPETFEARTADPIRNAKNYGIILNTLLRKAAEQGGVHPIHLDRTSSQFAHRIEALTSLTENAALMGEMFRTYCRLVRRYSLQKYSPVVRKAILTIDADLSADLSPHVLAEKLGISLGYLSTIMRKELGKTLTSFIHERRMEYASHLLTTTDLQIQSIALHCGILDVQYFSKLFKKQYHVTPSEYRLNGARGTRA